MAGPLWKVDWSKLISPDSEVARDVTFLVRGDDGEYNKFGAHKVLLAGVSPVFKTMFYGPMQIKEQEVEVKDASPDAFQFMIDYIYGIPAYIDDIPQQAYIKSLHLAFETYALGDRYDVLGLKAQIMDWLRRFKITRENFSDAATEAKRFELLGDPSKCVAQLCLRFYQNEADKNFPGGSGDILEELMEVGGRSSALQLSGTQILFWTDNFIPYTSVQIGVTLSTLTWIG